MAPVRPLPLVLLSLLCTVSCAFRPDWREETVDNASFDEVWEAMGLPVAECKEWVDRSELMRVYRTSLFARIVPTIRDIGLWGPRIRKAYADMGILGFAEGDLEGMGQRDEEVALSLEARLAEIRRTADAAAST